MTNKASRCPCDKMTYKQLAAAITEKVLDEIEQHDLAKGDRAAVLAEVMESLSESVSKKLGVK